MANAVGFEGANRVFRAPKDMENCVDLEVFQDAEALVSCWRLTKEELEEVNKTGVVWLRVVGGGTPPVLVCGHALVTVDGIPSKAEPYIPRARIGGQIDKEPEGG